MVIATNAVSAITDTADPSFFAYLGRRCSNCSNCSLGGAGLDGLLEHADGRLRRRLRDVCYKIPIFKFEFRAKVT